MTKISEARELASGLAGRVAGAQGSRSPAAARTLLSLGVSSSIRASVSKAQAMRSRPTSAAAGDCPSAAMKLSRTSSASSLVPMATSSASAASMTPTVGTASTSMWPISASISFIDYFSSWRAITMRWIWLVPS